MICEPENSFLPGPLVHVRGTIFPVHWRFERTENRLKNFVKVPFLSPWLIFKKLTRHLLQN